VGLEASTATATASVAASCGGGASIRRPRCEVLCRASSTCPLAGSSLPPSRGGAPSFSPSVRGSGERCGLDGGAPEAAARPQRRGSGGQRGLDEPGTLQR